MKASIIGGGIAGLAAGISLKKKGIQATVFERMENYSKNGMGFILMPNGMEALDNLGVGDEIRRVSKSLKTITLRDEKGDLIEQKALSETYAISRYDCIKILVDNLGRENIQFDCKFSHFEEENGKYKAACFENDKYSEADIFIGADGLNSMTRRYLYPDWVTSYVRVKELVGLIECPELATQMGDGFMKTQSSKQGLSFGIVPSGHNKIIWFLQFDSNLWDLQNLSPEAKKKFADLRVGNWPSPIPEILEKADFSNVYLWNTKDMDIPPSFFHNNLLLIGDALHPFLTFTSQGTNSALKDAVILGDNLIKNQLEIKASFSSFEGERRQKLIEYNKTGRQIANHFLNPLETSKQVMIPLIK